MSNKNQETIADIVAWLRRPIEGENAYLTLWRDEIADRIEAAWKREREAGAEAAHKREMADEKRISDAVIQSLRDKKLEMAGEIAAKDAEIKNLRSALKPVLELEDIYDGHWPFASLAADAVKESQRIYKEVNK